MTKFLTVYLCNLSIYRSYSLIVSLYPSQVAHPVAAYPSFHSMRWLGVSPLPPGWDASPSQSYPPPFHQASLTICWYPFILLVERSTVRVESFAQKHNTMTQPGLEFAPLYLESGAPTIRPTCLPPLLIKCTCVISFVVISIVCSSSTLSSRVGLFRWRSWRVASSCTDGKNKRLYSQDISQANWKWQN